MEFSLLWRFLAVGGVVRVACQGFLFREACVVLVCRAGFLFMEACVVLVCRAGFLLSGVQ